MWCTKKFVNVYFELVIIQNDHIGRMSNLLVVPKGSGGRMYGYSVEFNDDNSERIISCNTCIKNRFGNLFWTILLMQVTAKFVLIVGMDLKTIPMDT